MCVVSTQRRKEGEGSSDWFVVGWAGESYHRRNMKESKKGAGKARLTYHNFLEKSLALTELGDGFLLLLAFSFRHHVCTRIYVHICLLRLHACILHAIHSAYCYPSSWLLLSSSSASLRHCHLSIWYLLPSIHSLPVFFLLPS